MGAVGTVADARAAYDAQAWAAAYDGLTIARGESGLDAEDLERLATAAFPTGREEESAESWALAFQAFLSAGDAERAAGSAHWLAFGLLNRGEFARAAGWLGRAVRLLDDDGLDCVQRGFLIMATAIRTLWQGDAAGGAAVDRRGRRHRRQLPRPRPARLGRARAGAVPDRARPGRRGGRVPGPGHVAAISGEVSATVAGLAYCAVISSCQEVFDLRRAREWSSALTHWCDAQSDLVPYTGWCQIHRAEIMQVHAEWEDAAAAAERAYQRSRLSTDHATAGEAFYLLGELRRLRGDLALAEDDYRESSRRGREPQRRASLLRLAQGQLATAASTIRRVVEEPQERHALRASVLAAHVEIMSAVDDQPAALAAANELARVAALYDARC